MKNKILLEKLSTAIYYIAIFLFLIAFNFQDTPPPGGWVQQFLPISIGTAQIRDITFIDSLNGYAITGFDSTRSYILKTSNGGYNWSIKYNGPYYPLFQRIQFINKDTGYAIGDNRLFKTINSGENWTYQLISADIWPEDFYILNKDTIWLAMSESSVGGLFRTTNGGLNWTNQYYLGSTGNPNKIYMYNRNIGFMSAGGSLLKTTNSGVNWTLLSGQEEYSDIFFVDSLKGFYTNYTTTGKFYKTTNGGNNWIHIPLPIIPGYIYTSNAIQRFSYNNDTIYGVRCNVQISLYTTRAIVYKSTNGGINWGYQLPDTNWGFPTFLFTKFLNGKKGWCYLNNGIYTSSGGDSTIIVGINSLPNIVPKDYILFQNYPNPFNSKSNIRYKIEKPSGIKLTVFDILGKEVTTLLNKKQSSGTYEIKFDGNKLSSGIYFYTLFADGVRVDTKKAILIK